MKYAFIQRHRRVWPISVQCRVLQVSVAGYHEHFVRRSSNVQRRHLSDDALLVHIKAIHAETRGGYGWPRTWKELLARGIRVGKDRVQKLMQQHGIRAKGKRRFKVTTDSKHDLPIASNLLNRAFTVAEPDRVWVGDITYIATDEGWLFLAVVIDLFSRQVEVSCQPWTVEVNALSAVADRTAEQRRQAGGSRWRCGGAGGCRRPRSTR